MKRHSLVVVWLFAVALMPAEVSAQEGAPDSPAPASVRRPYRGLFGGPRDPGASQSLVLFGSLFGAYDTNVQAALTEQERVDPRVQESGEYFGANAGLSYLLSKTVDRVSFGVASGVFANSYRLEGDRSIVPHANVAASVGFMLGRNTSVSVTQQTIYTRYYRFMLFPSLLGTEDDGALAGDPDMELFARTALHYGAGIGLTHNFGPRSALNANYKFGYVDYREEQFPDWRSHGGSIAYTRRVTSHAALNLGYGYRVADSPATEGRAREVHDINVGVNYSRALSFSRRTSLRFSTGSAVLVSETTNLPGSDPRARFHLLGNAALTHELGRTWTAYVAYNRGFLFREGFDDPFLTDAVSSGIDGLITRRLDMSAVLRWSHADQSVGSNNQHDSLAGGAGLRYALSQYLALFARYIYYEYEFGEGVPLDPGLARTLDRHGVRVGITASFPLIR